MCYPDIVKILIISLKRAPSLARTTRSTIRGAREKKKRTAKESQSVILLWHNCNPSLRSVITTRLQRRFKRRRILASPVHIARVQYLIQTLASCMYVCVCVQTNRCTRPRWSDVEKGERTLRLWPVAVRRTYVLRARRLKARETGIYRKSTSSGDSYLLGIVLA